MYPGRRRQHGPRRGGPRFTAEGGHDAARGTHQRDPGGEWDFVDCAENNQHVVIGGETYMMSADGFLMPTKNGQKPPDLHYFSEKKTK